MSRAIWICKAIDAVSEWWGRIFAWVLVALTLLSCYEVFTRRILGKPTIWTHEILSYFFCASIMLLMGYAQLHRSHVNVDLLHKQLSPRAQAIMDLVSNILFAGLFCAVFLYEGTIFAATSWAMHERTPSAFNFIVYPAKTLIPVGVVMLTLQYVSDTIKLVVFLAKGERP